MQQISLKPMTPSPEAMVARRRDDRIVTMLVASLVACWLVVGTGCVLSQMQRAADEHHRV